MQDAKPTKEQFSSVEFSIMQASVRLVSAPTGFPKLEMRLWQKALKLVPEELHRFLRDYFLSHGGYRSGYKAPHGPDHPFRTFGNWVTWAERRSLKKLRAKLTQDQFLVASRRLKQEGASKVFRRLRPAFDDLDYEYVTERGLLALRLARDIGKDTAVFKTLLPLKKAFLAAIARNDLDFFARAGDVLRKRQISFRELVDSPATKLQAFLIRHWASERDGVPPLYNLPIKKLYEVCKKHLNQSNLTSFAVEKSRQRLGLKTFRKA